MQPSPVWLSRSSFTAGFGDLVSEPFESLAVATVERQGHEPIAELRDTQPLEFAPERQARRRRLAREAICQEHPLPGLRHRHVMAEARNHGYATGAGSDSAASERLPGMPGDAQDHDGYRQTDQRIGDV